MSHVLCLLNNTGALCDTSMDVSQSVLLPHCLESDDDVDLRKRLTEEQIARFYTELDAMHKAAMLCNWWIT
jgi:hypothetical protein